MIFEDVTNWSFDLSQYSEVWFTIVQIAFILIFLLIGNAIRRLVPFFKKGNIPSALIGGLLLFLFEIGLRAAGHDIINKRVMQIVTYHALAIGFIAMSLKVMKKNKSSTILSSIQNGALTGGTYMLQGVVGILISLIFFWAGSSLFYDSGVLLPLGFGQGPGNALTWDINFTSLTNDSSWTGPIFNGQGSVGLTIASIGFIVASIVGVTYTSIYKRKGEITHRKANIVTSVEKYEDQNEIEDSDSVDKFSIQIALVFVSYALAFGIMIFFYYLSQWTGIKLFNSIAWGFNFIWGVITANVIKLIFTSLRKKRVLKQKYINNYQMDRISGFAFDIMIVAGVAAIDIKVLSEYVWFIVAVCAAGTIVTLIYIRMMTKICFKDAQHEFFLVNFGALTGTASNGMIFLREVDPNYETNASDVYITSQLPAMVFVAPLLLLLNKSAETLVGCYVVLGIFITLFVLYTLFLILTGKGILFKKKKDE